MSDNASQRVLEMRSESKKKTNDTERKMYEAETQETTFKSSKLTDIFEHSLNSGTGHRVLAPSMWKTWNSFLGVIMSSMAPQSFPFRYWGKKAKPCHSRGSLNKSFSFPFSHCPALVIIIDFFQSSLQYKTIYSYAKKKSLLSNESMAS